MVSCTTQIIRCPICDSVARFYTKVKKFDFKFELYRCSTCNTITQYPQPTKDFYNQDYYSGKSEYSYIDERDDKIIRDIELERRLKNIFKIWHRPWNFGLTPSLLDIGCSFGALVEKAKKMGWKSMGYDMSPVSVGKKKDICKEPIIGKYDVVTLIETIEHLSDPRKALNNIYNGMKRGGLLVIQTANFRSWVRLTEGKNSRYFLPGHLHCFTDDTLISLLEESGFRLEKIYYSHETGFLPALIRKLLTNKGRYSMPDWLTFLYTLILHLCSKIYFLMPINGGMVIYVRRI